MLAEPDTSDSSRLLSIHPDSGGGDSERMTRASPLAIKPVTASPKSNNTVISVQVKFRRLQPIAGNQVPRIVATLIKQDVSVPHERSVHDMVTRAFGIVDRSLQSTAQEVDQRRTGESASDQITVIVGQECAGISAVVDIATGSPWEIDAAR